MKRSSLFSISLAVVALFAFVFARPVSAQDATPAVDLTVNPEECTVEPASIEELQAIVGTPHPEGAGDATSVARGLNPEPVDLPEGEPADEETIAAVTVTIRIFFACANAGDGLRGIALITDEFIVTQMGFAVYDEDTIAYLQSTPQPLPEDQQVELHGIREVTVYADGRVGVLVDYFSVPGPNSPADSVDGHETDLMIFEQQENGEWHLDEVIENLEGQHGPDAMGTPAA